MKRIFFALLLSGLVCATGCRTRPPVNAVSAMMTPNFHTGSLGIECLVSSTGNCYLAVFGLRGGNTTLEIATSKRMVLDGINEDTLYCAESRKALLKDCTQLLLPRQQAIVNMGIHSEAPIELAR